MNFNKNPCSETLVAPCGRTNGQTDMTMLTSLFEILGTRLKTGQFVPCREIIAFVHRSADVF